MIRRPPRSNRTDTSFPYTRLFRSQAVVVAAIEQVIGILNGGNARQVSCFGKLQVLRHAPRGFVGHPNVAHLAGLDEVLQYIQRFLDGHRVGVILPGVVWTTECSGGAIGPVQLVRSEEHTSELQSLMRNSYAVFCLKKKKNIQKN